MKLHSLHHADCANITQLNRIVACCCLLPHTRGFCGACRTWAPLRCDTVAAMDRPHDAVIEIGASEATEILQEIFVV